MRAARPDVVARLRATVAPSGADDGSDDGVSDQLPPPPTLRSVARRIGPRGLSDALVPLLIFLGADAGGGLASAMAATTVWSLGVVIARRVRRRAVGPLLWVTAGLLLARGAAGILTRSDAVYFGPAIVQTLLVGVLFAASALARRPAVEVIARFLYPFTPAMRRHRAYRAVFTRLTWAWAIYLVFVAGFQMWLVGRASADTFVVVRSVVDWPVALALFAVSLRYPVRVFRREPELAPLVAAAEAGRRSARS